MRRIKLLAAILLASTAAAAQSPNWTVTLTPTLSPLPIGLCGAVHLTLRDPVTRDVPRNPQGYRITMADFDLTVSGTAIAGHQIDSTHFETCGCQGSAIGTSATITARYPAQSLPAASRVPGVSFQQTATVMLDEVKGPVNPPSCVSLASNTPDAPGNPISAGVASGAPIARGPTRTPPASSAPPVAAASPPVATTAPPVATAAPPLTTAIPPAATTTAPVTTATPPVAIATGTDTRAPVGVAQPTPAAPATPVASSTPVVPVNPAGALAIAAPPDAAILMWDEVKDASFYVVFGPGLTPGGQRVENEVRSVLGQQKVSVGANNLPPGQHEWLIASYYPGNVSTPAAQFSKASANLKAPETETAAGPAPAPAAAATTAAASGKYLVTIAGIRAYSASMDDMLSRDGTGDEIYAAAYIRRYDRGDGKLVTVTTRKSSSHGDTFHFSNTRVQTGSSTPTGGIRDGDMIPGPAFIAMRNVLPQDATFPMQLWEGTMADGVDALVISPSLWEQDVGEGFFTQWLQYQATLNTTIFAKQGVQDQISQNAFGSLIFGMSGNDTNTAGMSHGRLIVDTVLMMFGGAVPILSITTTTQDRPLGLQQNGRDTSVLPNHTVILTREIVEKALGSPALGAIPSPLAHVPVGGIMNTVPAIAKIGVVAPKPGIIVVHFQDRGMFGTVGLAERPAIYQMYIQVERVP